MVYCFWSLWYLSKADSFCRHTPATSMAPARLAASDTNFSMSARLLETSPIPSPGSFILTENSVSAYFRTSAPMDFTVSAYFVRASICFLTPSILSLRVLASWASCSVVCLCALLASLTAPASPSVAWRLVCDLVI